MPTSTLDATHRRLLPVLGGPDQGPSLPLIPGHLYVVLHVQDGTSLRPVGDHELLDWDEPFVDLVHTAMWNLRGQSHRDQIVDVATVPGMLRVAVTDGLAASRVLCLQDLIGLWPLEGVVVACPRPDQLVMVPLDSLAALPALQVLLRTADHARRTGEATLSDQLFWCDGDDWHLLPVVFHDGRVDLDPPAAFVGALERLTAVCLVPEAAEA